MESDALIEALDDALADVLAEAAGLCAAVFESDEHPVRALTASRAAAPRAIRRCGEAEVAEVEVGVVMAEPSWSVGSGPA